VGAAEPARNVTMREERRRKELRFERAMASPN
jgi:hypothetical protein